MQGKKMYSIGTSTKKDMLSLWQIKPIKDKEDIDEEPVNKDSFMILFNPETKQYLHAV